MTYTPTVWTNNAGEPINDDNLNKIEIGIADAHEGFAERALAITTILPAAGSPLTGGGDLSANRTFDIDEFTDVVKGAVPPPGTVAPELFLCSDGTWTVPAAVDIPPLPEGGGRYAANIGGTTAQVVSHALGTRDVIVQLYRNSTPWDTIEPLGVERTDEDTVTITFSVAPAVAEYRVVVLA